MQNSKTWRNSLKDFYSRKFVILKWLLKLSKSYVNAFNNEKGKTLGGFKKLALDEIISWTKLLVVHNFSHLDKI